jgi:hypothetical protein
MSNLGLIKYMKNWEVSKMEIIGRVPRGTDMEIRIQTGVVWKINVCDIRWFKEQSTTENGIRTKKMEPRKGIRMNMDELKHVYDLLGRILNENEQMDKRASVKKSIETFEPEKRSITESDREVLRDWEFDS